jgi:multidrug resistance efflux pump
MSRLPPGAGKLYVTMIVVLAAVVWITLRYEGRAAHFYGIAGTKEIVVNSETAVEIKEIAVNEGQAVEKGQLLVRLHNPELALRIAQLIHQIEELKAQKGATKAELRARAAQLRAERATRVAETRSRITQLQNQYRINKNLAAGLESLGASEMRASTQNPLTLRVAALERDLAFAVQPIDIRVRALQQQIDAPTSAAKIQLQRLEQQLRLLRAENDRLEIVARIAGVIGSVNFKVGEKVAPFAPILTLSARTPSFIKGYIHENMHTSVGPGDRVKASSLAAGGAVNTARPSFVGRVVGVGSRIVAYPRRLSKSPDIQLWGREVIVRIPAENDLILGEKVMIEAASTGGLPGGALSSRPAQAARLVVKAGPR